MSTLTPVWTTEMLRKAIANLDAKTGLSGARLAVRLNKRETSLGLYHPGVGFEFSSAFFNDRRFPEADAIDVIRHEYAHYYDDVLDLKKWIPTPQHIRHHGPDWKYACIMVGAAPERVYHRGDVRPIETLDEAYALFCADDVRKLDIREHIRRWDCLPHSEETLLRLDRRLQQTLPDRKYFRPWDRVVHPQVGFACVIATYPDHAGLQHLWLRFENGKEGRYTNEEVVKISR